MKNQKEHLNSIVKEPFKKKVLLLKQSDFMNEGAVVYVDLSEICLEEDSGER